MTKYAFSIVAILATALGVSGCNSSSLRLPSSAAPLVVQPVAVQQPPRSNVPTVEINAPVKTVRDTIIARAKSRGTTVASIETSGVVLEKTMQSSPPALESSCGPHRKGRMIRVLLGTSDQGATTLVSEQRFVVDDGAECRIQATSDVINDAQRSLNELKSEVESKLTRR